MFFFSVDGKMGWVPHMSQSVEMMRNVAKQSFRHFSPYDDDGGFHTAKNFPCQSPGRNFHLMTKHGETVCFDVRLGHMMILGCPGFHLARRYDRVMWRYMTSLASTWLNFLLCHREERFAMWPIVTRSCDEMIRNVPKQSSRRKTGSYDDPGSDQNNCIQLL